MSDAVEFVTVEDGKTVFRGVVDKYDGRLQLKQSAAERLRLELTLVGWVWPWRSDGEMKTVDEIYGELAAQGQALDGVAEILDTIQREMLITTADAGGTLCHLG